MLGVLAVVAFLIAWIFHAAGFHAPAWLNGTSFALAGLAFLALHLVVGSVLPVPAFRRTVAPAPPQ